MDIPFLDQNPIHNASLVHSVVALTDTKGRIIYVNDKFVELSGYTRDELIGQSHQLINSGTHSAAFFKNLWDTISAGDIWQGQICNKSKCGEIYWLDATIQPVRNAGGDIIAYTSIRTDITSVVLDRTQQQQMRENAESLKKLNILCAPKVGIEKMLQAALEMLFSLSWLDKFPKGAIFLLDDHGSRPHLVASINVDQLSHVCKSLELRDDLQDWVDEKDLAIFAWSLNYKAEAGCDEQQPIGCLSLPIRGGDGMLGVLALDMGGQSICAAHQEIFLENFCQTLGLFIENKQQRAYLQKAVDEAQKLTKSADIARKEAVESTHAKSNFLATMSHEIRTPMNGVLGMLGLLRDTHLNEAQRELTEMANGSANSLMAIINDILDFSKYETANFSLENKPFELIPAFKQIIEPLKNLAGAKDINLILDFADDLPAYILGDITRIGQVVTNLLSNAIKFTTKGEVRFCLSKIGHASNPKLQIMVRDTGIGMSEKAQVTIFDRFSQADTSITRKFGGTGLGLSIVKKLADAMHGTVTVTSELGKGTQFTFELPLNEADAQIVSETAKAKESTQKSLRILVAEDHPANQFLLRKLLEIDHHEITMVDNGQQAVNAVESGSFDLVLMDVQMPIMDGIAAMKAIRALRDDRARIPIIAVTADVMADQVERVHMAGADAHIGKPIHPAELFTSIATCTAPKMQPALQRQKTA